VIIWLPCILRDGCSLCLLVLEGLEIVNVLWSSSANKSDSKLFLGGKWLLRISRHLKDIGAGVCCGGGRISCGPKCTIIFRLD